MIMISALIFSAHLIFMLVIFTKKWQDDSLSSAFINMALVIILFSVGWSITTSIVKIFIDQKGFGLYYNSDDISLSLLSIAEFFFYRIYYGKDKPATAAGTEK